MLMPSPTSFCLLGIGLRTDGLLLRPGTQTRIKSKKRYHGSYWGILGDASQFVIYCSFILLSSLNVHPLVLSIYSIQNEIVLDRGYEPDYLGADNEFERSEASLRACRIRLRN